MDVDREDTARVEREHYDPEARSGHQRSGRVRIGAARPFTTRTPGPVDPCIPLYPTPKDLNVCPVDG